MGKCHRVILESVISGTLLYDGRLRRLAEFSHEKPREFYSCAREIQLLKLLYFPIPAFLLHVKRFFIVF